MEAEAIKLMVQGGAIGLSAGAIVLIGFVLFNVFQGDKRDAAERQQFMAMVEGILTRQAETNADTTRQIVAQMRVEFQATMTEWQRNFNLALDRWTTATQDRMTQVTADRTRTLETMHADIKTVPLETWRLGDPILEALRQSLITYIDQTADRIIAKIDPRAEIAQQVVRDELERAKLDFAQGCAGTLRRLDEIGEVVRKLEERTNGPEAGESSPQTPETKPEPTQEG